MKIKARNAFKKASRRIAKRTGMINRSAEQELSDMIWARLRIRTTYSSLHSFSDSTYALIIEFCNSVE